jgi:hypothetical protein
MAGLDRLDPAIPTRTDLAKNAIPVSDSPIWMAGSSARVQHANGNYAWYKSAIAPCPDVDQLLTTCQPPFRPRQATRSK